MQYGIAQSLGLFDLCVGKFICPTVHIDGLHLNSRRLCWSTEQCSKMSFGNLTLLLCKTYEAIFYCFVHQHGYKLRIDRQVYQTPKTSKRDQRMSHFMFE